MEIIDNRAFGFDGDETARLLDILQKEILQKKFTNSCKIEIIGDTQSHMGFGSGTAIRLAAIEGLYLMNDYTYTSDELIAASGRGGTSGVGVHTYFHGGYSFDVGRKSGVLAPSCSVESKYTKPLHIAGGKMPDWKIGICIPNSIRPNSEAEEKEFFDSTCPIEPYESYEATYHAVFGLLAGAKDRCLDSFCEAVQNIQQCKWKSAERSLYGDRLFEIEKAPYDCGASAVGMSNPDKKLFIIEDTSVDIDAFSRDGNEVPGLDVKYWMRENDFNSVDAALKTNGNNRKCYVRSDIVLHLTKELREKHGKEFMQFTGFSHGSIAAQEFDYKTNPLYPWLDNKTFNKWFVPDGADMPLGMMDIDKACRYDFRKDALDRLLSFLEEEKIIQKKSNITSKKYHRFTFFENFVLVGPTCAGKSTLANFLAEKLGYYHIEASDFMYQKYHQLHGAKPSVSIGDFAAKALEENICAVAKPIVKHVIGLDDTPFVISGFRHPQEIECFLAEYKKNIKTLYVDASLDIRFERSIARKRPDDHITKENFVAKNEQQMSMGLAKMGEEIGEKLLNESSIENYCLGFCTKYKDCLPDEIEIKRRISTKLTLEKAILVALYLSETNNGYTTTEIAKLILEKLNIVKSKNNVSRYFNQNIHPYYEIVEGSEPLKYKLNGTGESAARLVLSA